MADFFSSGKAPVYFTLTLQPPVHPCRSARVGNLIEGCISLKYKKDYPVGMDSPFCLF